MRPLPALAGGAPACPAGPPDWPPFDAEVEQSVLAALREGSWGKYQGGLVERLEQRLAALHGATFALCCASGTYAVELALRALQVGSGDEVLLAAYDYPGNFLTIHALGARPVLIDVAAHNWNLDPARLAEAVGPRTRALIVSHLHGGLVPMAELVETARAGGLKVVEDACQCPGATVQGRPAGTWGDVGVLSFGGSKLLTAGRGGALLTADAGVHQRARTHTFRGNLVAPLSEIQAAALLPQIDRLAERHAHRSRQAKRLVEGLRPLPGLRPFENIVDGSPAFYKLGFRYDAEAFGLPRQRLTAALRAEGVALDEGFRALHVGRSPSRYRRGGPLDEAERAHEGALVLHHPLLLQSDAMIDQAAEAFHKVHHHRPLLE